MVRDTVRSLWAEPRAAAAARARVAGLGARRALVPTALLEGVLRDDVVWRPVSLLLGGRVALDLAVAAYASAWQPSSSRSAPSSWSPSPSLVGDADGVGGALHDRLRRAAPLLAVALGKWPGDRHRAGAHPGHRVLGIAADYTGVVDSVAGMPLPALPGDARRDGRATGRRPGCASSTRSSSGSASSWPASCTTRSPTTSRPSPSRPRRGGSSPRPTRTPALDALGVIEEEASPDARRDAHHGGRSPRRRGGRARPAARGGRHRAARAERRETGPPCRGRAVRRPRRPQAVGRGGGLPHRPGVGHERRTARPSRHPHRGPGHRRRGLRPPDGERRRAGRVVAGQRPGRLRPRRHDRAGDAPRRLARGRPRAGERLDGRRGAAAGRGSPRDHPGARRRRPGRSSAPDSR